MVDNSRIIQLADASPLRQYHWRGHREHAPKAYIRGMAVAFARLRSMFDSVDDGSASRTALAHATAQHIGDPAHDVLAWYAPELRDAGAFVETAHAKLVALFAIMVGLGMRESSGRHCVGADTPEDRREPTTEENAEAGLFQVSYDSIHRDPLRQALFDYYRGRTDLLDVFSEGIHCGDADWRNHGDGAGATFQETMKRNPLFAVQYTALFLRGHRKHWGPINRKEAEVRSEAVSLFLSIQQLIETAHT